MMAPIRIVARCGHGRFNLRAFNRVVEGANNLTEMPADANLQYASSEARLKWVQDGAVAFYSPPIKYHNPMMMRIRPFYASNAYSDAIEVTNSPNPKPNRRLAIGVHFVSNRSSGYWVNFFSTDAEDVCTWWPF
jgi:hypothetical protein